MKKNNLVAILLPNLEGGGAECISVKLANELVRRGYRVDMVLLSAIGPFLEILHPEIRVVNLKIERFRELFFPLINYLRKSKPEVLLACMWPITVIALASKMLSLVKVRVVVAEHATWSVEKARYSVIVRFLMQTSMHIFFQKAEGIVAVSSGAADDLANYAGINRKSISMIYNPIVDSKFTTIKHLELPLFPEWNSAEVRILTVGNLKDQKNHQLLLYAFSILLKNVKAHLLILGEGSLRKDLEELVIKLGIKERVSMPGFVNDPSIYYQKASVFVLSSNCEGLPTVLIEALALGIPVVSTDCPSGPREILCDGKFGTLVSMNNAEDLARAMFEAVFTKHDAAALKERAQDFSIDKAVDKYERLLFGLNIKDDNMQETY